MGHNTHIEIEAVKEIVRLLCLYTDGASHSGDVRIDLFDYFMNETWDSLEALRSSVEKQIKHQE